MGNHKPTIYVFRASYDRAVSLKELCKALMK